MGAAAVLRGGVAGDALVGAALGLDGVLEDFRQGPHLGAGQDHGLHRVEDVVGLVALGRRAVELGGRLVVEIDDGADDGRRQLGLAVAAAHEEEGLAVAAGAVGPLPAEEVCHQRPLPVFQQKGLAGFGAVGIGAALLDEVDVEPGRLIIEETIAAGGHRVVARQQPDEAIQLGVARRAVPLRRAILLDRLLLPLADHRLCLFRRGVEKTQPAIGRRGRSRRHSNGCGPRASGRTVVPARGVASPVGSPA